MGRHRRNREEWRVLLGEFAASGQTLEAFCTERGLNEGYFRKKRAQLRRQVDAAPFVRADVAVNAPIRVQIQDVEVHCSSR
jgi:hypothetical protein